MPRSPRIYGISGYYHIILRGIGKQLIFEEDADFLCFLSICKKLLGEEDFKIFAYCLMDNHIHLLVHSDSGLSRIMKRMAGKYATYFNRKYDRAGHLFQDRFKSKPLENLNSILRVTFYIHNNPEKAGICTREQYRWSSWQEYAGKAFLVSTDLIFALTGGYDGFLKMSFENKNTMESDLFFAHRMTDAEALDMLKREWGINDISTLNKMPCSERKKILRKMKQHSLSVRQISRLTGIGRGIIARA